MRSEITIVLRPRVMSKWLLIAVAAVVCVSLAIASAAVLERDRIIDSAIRHELTSGTDPSFGASDGRLRVLLCGTGSPEPSTARAQACTAVSAGGRTFLFDAGEGAVGSLHSSGFDVTALSGIFLTHLHSDHFGGLGAVLNQAWLGGRTHPIPITGPPGVAGLVSGLESAYRADTVFRTSQMPELAEARSAAAGAPVEVQIPAARTSIRVYDDAGVTIDAFRVSHEPVEPAYGYVIRFAGKKVFVSGDTRVAPGNLPAMHGADLVVHEAYATSLVERALPIMRELGQTSRADMTERTLTNHADTLELARQAQQAGVKRLVLTHLTPYPNGFLARRLFVSGMDDLFDGEIVLGSDGLLLVV